MLCYRFRLYPGKQCEAKLVENLKLCRWLYNKLLELKKKAREENRCAGKRSLQAMLVDLKKENQELQKVHSKVLQMVNNQLHYNIRALAELKRSGKKVGFLRFKGEGRYNTLNYNQEGFSIDFEHKKLHLSKIGIIPIKLHRKFNGKVKGIIIKRTKVGKWFALIQVDEDRVPLLPETKKSVGIDVGIKHLLTDSDGRHIENPRYYQITLERIRVLQKDLSRKRKDSTNRRNSLLKLGKVYEKLVDQRDDLLHKLSRFYVNNYDIIAVEELKIRKMIRNRNFAQRILDASWGRFFQMLSYKAERAGRMLIKEIFEKPPLTPPCAHSKA